MKSILSITILFSLLVLPALAGATVWHLNPEGTGDAPTIHAALQLAEAGDIIELACGTYAESTTMETMLRPISGLTIRSENGDPACVTIDAEQPQGWGSVLHLDGVEGVLIEGMTITGGNAVDSFLSSRGGGALVMNSSDVVFRDCEFSGNRGRVGGGVAVEYSEVVFEDCLFTGNEALVAGGGLYLNHGTVVVLESRILDNASGMVGSDGGIYGDSSICSLECCEIEVENWIVASGILTILDENCGPVANARVPWDGLKAAFR